MNRDESLERLESEPFYHHKGSNVGEGDSGEDNVRGGDKGAWQYWHPVDGAAGGTWFGVHANGWALALLNRYQDHQAAQKVASISPGNMDAVKAGLVKRASAKTSRGHLIPSLLQYNNFTELKKALLGIRLEDYSPCDLWCFSLSERIQISWNGRWHTRSTAISQQPFFTYSSSADVVEAGHYRTAQFQDFLTGPRCAESALTNLHQASCSYNASLGFNMSRPGRHTKSICQAILGEGAPSLRYVIRDTNNDFIDHTSAQTKMYTVS